MSTRTVAQTIARVQDLLDDPAGRRFSPDYIRPKIDAANEEFSITLEQLGVQQQEVTAIFDVPAATTAPLDLTPYFSTGQPLEFFLRPKSIDWKLQGQPDTDYIPSGRVDELDDVPIGNVGCPQYKWAGGTLWLTPSYTAVTLRVIFWSLALSITTDNVAIMRGIGHLLALDSAITICGMNNRMGALQAELTTRRRKAKISFKSLMVMEKQAELIVPRGTKRGAAVQISAGGTPYL